jgi:hypothetical protein
MHGTIVHLSSTDVIHSFGLPQMRVKQDAIPGVEQRLWFTPTKTGEWEIACSQLCGLGHRNQRLVTKGIAGRLLRRGPVQATRFARGPRAENDPNENDPNGSNDPNDPNAK